MNPEMWRRAREIFEAALDMDPNDRGASGVLYKRMPSNTDDP